jgi:hypothetical protein
MRTSLHNAKLWGADTVLLVRRWANRKHAGLGRSQIQIRQLVLAAG